MATYFPDGIKIGPDATGNERLPIYEFDEWAVDGVEIGTLAAGEVKTLVVDIANIRTGAKVFATMMNPAGDTFNFDKLAVKHVWCSDTGKVSIMVKNDSNSEVTYGTDQWQVSFWNTTTPPVTETP